ncbi:MAG TPA: NUDIX hydrolase [Patescibacteria group bacterium]|nr:NUDIX hydrolase [Patescibacteria group bacterium]
MKLNFTWQDDGQLHQYCINCHTDGAEKVNEGGKRGYHCAGCGLHHPRAIVIDPAIKYTVEPDGEYKHEVSAIFVREPGGKFLFFELTKFPFGVTVPAGHIDAREQPADAAKRELKEEVGLSGEPLEFFNEEINPESCSRGSDVHRWHAFVVELSDPAEVNLNDEGMNPVWLTLDEAVQKDLTVAVRSVLKTSAGKLAKPAAF